MRHRVAAVLAAGLLAAACAPDEPDPQQPRGAAVGSTQAEAQPSNSPGSAK
jgi:hypothetical protein